MGNDSNARNNKRPTIEVNTSPQHINNSVITGYAHINVSNCETNLIKDFVFKGEKPHYNPKNRKLTVIKKHVRGNRTFIVQAVVYVGKDKDKYMSDEMMSRLYTAMRKEFIKVEQSYLKLNQKDNDKEETEG